MLLNESGVSVFRCITFDQQPKLWVVKMDAIERKIESTIPLVKRLVGRYSLPGRSDYDDLYSAALGAVWKAAREYDNLCGTWAGFAEQSVRWAIYRVMAERRRGKNRVNETARSLSEPIGEEGEELGDLFPDSRENVEQAVLDEERKRQAFALLGRLNTRERKIIHDRFYCEKTFAEIAKTEGVTYQRVEQLQARAIQKMREPMAV